jgi:hypothetical protein
MCVKQWNSQTSKSDQSIGLDVTFQLYLPTPNNRTKLPIRFCHLQTILHTIPTKEHNARFQLSYGTTDILLPQKNKTSVRIRAAVKPNLLFSDGPGAWPSEEPLLQWQQPTHSNSPIISNSTGHSPPEISRIRIAPPAPPKHRNSSIRDSPQREKRLTLRPPRWLGIG